MRDHRRIAEVAVAASERTCAMTSRGELTTHQTTERTAATDHEHVHGAFDAGARRVRRAAKRRGDQHQPSSGHNTRNAATMITKPITSKTMPVLSI